MAARSRKHALDGLRLVLDGDEWRVRTWPGPFVYLDKGEASSPCVGLTEREERTITLALGVAGPDLADNFLHEILHAVWPAGIVDAEMEERLVTGLEHRLRAALTRNRLGQLLARLEQLPPPEGVRIEPAPKRARTREG